MKEGIGKTGELIAARFLLQKGYTLVAQNYFTKWGEIDIIAKKDETLVFVEVKTTTLSDAYQAEQRVDALKMEKCLKAATRYLQEGSHEDEMVRFDVVAVQLNQTTKEARVQHFENITA